MEMTIRDKIALAFTCAGLAGGYGPGESGSYAITGYEAADEFMAEMLNQRERMDMGGCHGGKDHQPYTNEDGSVTCYRCNQAL